MENGSWCRFAWRNNTSLCFVDGNFCLGLSGCGESHFFSWESTILKGIIICLHGNSIRHCLHSLAGKQTKNGLLLWWISVNGCCGIWTSFTRGSWHLAGLHGFLWLPPFFPWPSFVGCMRPLLDLFVRLGDRFRNSKWFFRIPVISATQMLCLHKGSNL